MSASYELDLNTKEKQYYHVGVGASSESIVGALKQLNVKHQVSEY